MKNYDLTLSDISPKLAKEVKKVRNSNTIAFENWLSDNNYKPTNGTPSFPSGLTDYHTQEGAYYSTTKLCIEYNDNK